MAPTMSQGVKSETHTPLLKQQGVVSPTFILVRPQLAENVGTCFRALWNCGLQDLRLVSPKAWPHEKGLKAAAGAHTHLDRVRVFESIQEATADLNCTFATTARRRDMVKPFFELPQFWPQVLNGVFGVEKKTLPGQHVVTHKKGQCEAPQHPSAWPKVGVLFGPERTGMTSDEVSWATGILSIPLNPEYTSLNLAQAVLLVAYHFWRYAEERFQPGREDHGERVSSAIQAAQRDTDAELFPERVSTKSAPEFASESEVGMNKRLASPLASQEDLHGFLVHLERLVEASGFFYPPELAPTMRRNVRNIFSRLTLSAQELRTLRGILTALEKWRR
jgi:tRNA/rRNA methyltransferase